MTGEPHPLAGFDDYWRLAEIMRDYDAASGDVELDRIISPIAEPEVVFHVAMQRTSQCIARWAYSGQTPLTIASAMWVEGFLAGYRLRRLHEQPDAGKLDVDRFFEEK